MTNIFRRNPLLPLLLLSTVLALPASLADETVFIALTQASESGGNPLPRSVVGVAAPAGSSSLPFHVALDFRCPAGTVQQQIFISVADTSRLEDATGLAAPQVFRMDVPLRQLQWLMAPSQACDDIGAKRQPDEVDREGTRWFRLDAGTAGYATLVCVGEAGKRWSTTVGTPLDVWLSCPAESPVPAAPE